jgi:ABC-type multidrug transport system fused ATPase/permease subunit
MTEFIHPDDESGGPKIDSLKDYLLFLQYQWRTIRTIFREFTTPLTRRKSAEMVGYQLLGSGCNTANAIVGGLALQALATKQFESVQYWLGVLMVIITAMFILNWLAGRSREWVLGMNMVQIVHRIDQYMFDKPLGQHEMYGSVLNTATIDKGRWRALSIQETVIFQMIHSIASVLTITIGLWYLHPAIGALGTSVTVLFLASSVYLNYFVAKYVDPIEREDRRINRRRIEFWEKVTRVITSGQGQKIAKELHEAMDKNMARDRRFWTWFIGMHEIRTFIQSLYYKVFLVAFGMWLAVNGYVEIGFLFPILMWSGDKIGNLMQLASAERQLGRDIIPVHLMMEALLIKPSFDMHAGVPLERNGPLAVDLQNVSFEYEDPKKGGKSYTALKNVSLSIKPGETIAVLGGSGAGKTTLMKLILRFYDPTSGQILINGQPLQNINLPSYMRQVGYVPQQPPILDATLEENLLFGCDEETRAELTRDNHKKLWEMMRKFMVDFGERLTDGVKTLCGKAGLLLSGGQQQRVAILAAILKNPRLTVIDEGTSNLDSVTEHEVQIALAAARETGVTTIIIAHRLNTVRNCDRFIVLKKAEDTSEGESQVEAIANSFEELYEVSPTFRFLSNAQGLAIESLAA